MKKNKWTFKNKIYFLLPFISVGLLILFWIIFSNYNSKLLATPQMVFNRTVKMFHKPIMGHTLFGQIGMSLQRIGISLIFAVILGILIGTVMAWSKLGRSIVGTMFNFIRPIPPLAWVPMIVVWFGIGELSKYILVWRGGVVPLIENTYTGVKMADKNLIDVGRTFRATETQIFLELVLPGALPAIFAGFKNAIGVSLMVVLAAEMMGASVGLGFLITRGMAAGDISLIMIGMICIGLLGAGLSTCATFLERRLCPWIKRLN